LYVNPKSDWILELDESDIQPFLIQRFLVMNDKLREAVRYLDKYVFYLPPKMYLSLAWTLIPKSSKAPYVKYISKEKKEEEEYEFILSKVRKHLELSDHDYEINKGRIIDAIKTDMPKWFKYYAIPKKYWKLYNIEYIEEWKIKPKREYL
jgi:hypothetical protein